jgi:hypothetical protein
LTSFSIMDVSQAAPADILRGFRIGVTSDRRSADLIAALERRGAQVLHAPALTIVPNDQDDSLIIETAGSSRLGLRWCW